jgi:hypothetical protein
MAEALWQELQVVAGCKRHVLFTPLQQFLVRPQEQPDRLKPFSFRPSLYTQEFSLAVLCIRRTSRRRHRPEPAPAADYCCPPPEPDDLEGSPQKTELRAPICGRGWKPAIQHRRPEYPRFGLPTQRLAASLGSDGLSAGFSPASALSTRSAGAICTICFKTGILMGKESCEA